MSRRQLRFGPWHRQRFARRARRRRLHPRWPSWLRRPGRRTIVRRSTPRKAVDQRPLLPRCPLAATGRRSPLTALPCGGSKLIRSPCCPLARIPGQLGIVRRRSGRRVRPALWVKESAEPAGSGIHRSIRSTTPLRPTTATARSHPATMTSSGLRGDAAASFKMPPMIEAAPVWSGSPNSIRRRQTGRRIDRQRIGASRATG